MKKIFVFIIVLITVVSQVSAKVENNLDTKIKTVSNKNREYNIDIDKKLVEYNYIEESEVVEDDGFVLFDIAVFASCWWSPNPWWETDGGLECYNVYIDFRGIPKESGNVQIKVYWQYADQTEELIKTKSVYFNGILWDFIRLEGLRTTENKPTSLRVETITAMSEITTGNNNANPDIVPGVTIEGYLYKKDTDGNLEPLVNVFVTVLSHLSFYDSEYFTSFTHAKIEDIDWWDDGYFPLVAPLKNGNKPCNYLVKSTYESKTIFKKTEKLNAFENTTMENFVFGGSKVKNFNNIFQKILKNYPLLDRIFRFLRFY